MLTALFVSANSKDKVDFSDYMPFEFSKKKAKTQEDLYEQIIAGEYQ
ncbi:hypothetical protein [Ignatzschineria sp. F8392]|nr:hypothetical protein [Ignatzschineria sp. F8392]